MDEKIQELQSLQSQVITHVRNEEGKRREDFLENLNQGPIDSDGHDLVKEAKETSKIYSEVQFIIIL